MTPIPLPSKQKHLFMALRRKPFLFIDARWASTKFKWIWDEWAGPHETYSGYVSYWDEIPWGTVRYDDGVARDFNFAARSQYIPTYSGDVLGYVEDIIALLESDRIDRRIIEAQHSHTAMPQNIPLRDLFYKNFNPANVGCPIVFSRPVSYTFGEPGNICDSAHESYLCTTAITCDGSEGLKYELGVNYLREFFSDAIHFAHEFPSSYLPEITVYNRLVCYIIGCGSIPRICINGTWHVISPDYFPPYGDPYGFVYNPIIAAIPDHGLRFGTGETNEIIVEHVAPWPEDLGAQVIFSLEYFEEA